MKGMISPFVATSQGPKFYRLMGFIAVIFHFVFVILEYIFLEGVHELFWDRAIVILMAIVTITMSRKKDIPRKYIYISASALFYVFIAQIVLAMWMNNFHPAHMIFYGLSLQTISISFKTFRQSFFFLVFGSLAYNLAVRLAPELNEMQQFYFSFGEVFFALLLGILAYLKVRFDREKRVREELLRTIVSKTEDSILLTDFEGFIYEANERSVEMFGYSIEELEGVNFSDLRYKPLSEVEDAEGVRQLLRSKFWNDEIQLKNKDGELFYGFVSITWIQRFGKEYLLYKVADISERKQFEADLIAAKEVAERATTAKSEFLATMSHEIRTPMNGVLGMTNILLESELSPQQQNYVETIKKSGESLLVIINDILDFSKIESGKMLLDSHSVKLKDLMDDVYDLMSVNADKKGLELKVNVDSEVPEAIIGDSTRLRQILVNLTGNAIKFTTSGLVEVDLKWNKQDRQLLCSVQDSGIGIPQEQLKKLFESFTQVDSSTTRKYGGTGLGLAICKQLVELMGGDIWVSSKPGVGSTFGFTIPCTVCHEEAEIGSEMEPISEEAQLSEMNVLLAEDNLVNQQVGYLMLKNMGLEADVVSNGEEVLSALKKKKYDIILMDIHMPEMDGLEATKIIRSKSELDYLSIVALTANAFEEDKKKCLDAGMDAFLTKPMQPEELRKVLLNCKSSPYKARA